MSNLPKSVQRHQFNCEWDGLTKYGLKGRPIEKASTLVCNKPAVWAMGVNWDGTKKFYLCEECARFQIFGSRLQNRYPINGNPIIAKNIEMLVRLVKAHRRICRSGKGTKEETQRKLLLETEITKWPSIHVAYAEKVVDDHEEELRDLWRDENVGKVLKLYANGRQ